MFFEKGKGVVGSNNKFNAVTLGFQRSYRRCARRNKSTQHFRRYMKRTANRLTRRAWYDGVPRATDWCW